MSTCMLRYVLPMRLCPAWFNGKHYLPLFSCILDVMKQAGFDPERWLVRWSYSFSDAGYVFWHKGIPFYVFKCLGRGSEAAQYRCRTYQHIFHRMITYYSVAINLCVFRCRSCPKSVGHL